MPTNPGSNRFRRLLLRALLLLAAILGIAAVLPETAAAQVPCIRFDPNNPACVPGGEGSGPEVSITPAGGTFTSASLAVTIHFCDDFPLDGGLRVLTLNDQPVSSTWSSAPPSGCNFAYVSTATLTLSPGENTLRATITDAAGLPGGAVAVFTLGQAGPVVSVIPDGKEVVRGANQRQTESFTVRNVGNVSAAFTLTAWATGRSSGGREAGWTRSPSPARTPSTPATATASSTRTRAGA